MDYNSEIILFEEKQYLGYNKSALLSRIILILFCFIPQIILRSPTHEFPILGFVTLMLAKMLIIKMFIVIIPG